MVRIVRDGRSFVARVDRHDLADVRLVAAQLAMRGDVELGQQPGARDAAADEQPVAGGEAAEQVPAAEPFRGDRAGVVGQVDGDERKPPAAFLHARRRGRRRSLRLRSASRSACGTRQSRYARGRCASSASGVSMPSSANFAAVAGPTPAKPASACLSTASARSAARELVADLVERHARVRRAARAYGRASRSSPTRVRRGLRSWRRSRPRSLLRRSSSRCGRRRRRTAARCSCPRADSLCAAGDRARQRQHRFGEVRAARASLPRRPAARPR